MGVDWFKCSGCSETYPDCGEYFLCECEESFCSDRCAKAKNYGEWDKVKENNRIDKSVPTTCKICRKEYARDEDLLYAVLRHFNISREKAFEIWKQDGV